MTKEYKLVHVEKPEEAAWGIIGRGLSAFNLSKVHENKFDRVCYTIQDEDGNILGGILGEVNWGWLLVDLLWLEEEIRGQGYGHRLLSQLEEDARKLGAKHAYLDTFSFQVPEFYKEHGYEVFGELEDYPAGHQKYFLRKDL
jgi:N-acetylglutamate synthase-like GNAT family acetyltransferase